MERRGKCHVTMVAKFLDHNNRELKQGRRRRQRERQKRNMFILAKQQLCTYITFFLVHFSAVVARQRHEKSLFHGTRLMEYVNTRNNFLFLNLETVLSDSTRKNFANIWQIEWNWLRAMKFKTVRIQIFRFLRSRNFATMATWRNNFSPLLCSIFNLLLFLTIC